MSLLDENIEAKCDEIIYEDTFIKFARSYFNFDNCDMFGEGYVAMSCFCFNIDDKSEFKIIHDYDDINNARFFITFGRTIGDYSQIIIIKITDKDFEQHLAQGFDVIYRDPAILTKFPLTWDFINSWLVANPTYWIKNLRFKE